MSVEDEEYIDLIRVTPPGEWITVWHDDGSSEYVFVIDEWDEDE